MELLSCIEHTFLKPNATEKELRVLCEEAKEYGFGFVAVNPAWVSFCKKELRGTSVLVDAAVGFPLGQVLSITKKEEARHCIAAGADEIDMVMNIGMLIAGDEDYVYQDILGVVTVCHEAGILCKVIIETCLLSDEQKIKACQIAEKAGADFVKTSTGFSTGGATVEDIVLMRKTVSNQVRIKASAGIRNLEQALALIAAGADRLGTSAGVLIAQEWNKRND